MTHNWHYTEQTKMNDEEQAVAEFEKFRRLCDREPTLIQWAVYREQLIEDTPTLH